MHCRIAARRSKTQATGKLMDNFKKMLDFLNELKQRNIHFTLEHNCPESVMVMIAVPGERWEVEFFADEPVRVEIFRSSDVEHNPEKELERLLRDLSD